MAYSRMWQPCSHLCRLPFSSTGVLPTSTPTKVWRPSFVKISRFSQSYVARSSRSRPSQWDISSEPAGPKCHCGEPAVEHIVRAQHGKGILLQASKRPSPELWILRVGRWNCCIWPGGMEEMGGNSWRKRLEGGNEATLGSQI